MSEADKAEARRVGLARVAQARALDRNQPFGEVADDKRVYVDCYAALAECAVATWLNLPWTKLVDDLSVKPPDVGTNIEVRWSPREFGHLIGHDEDRSDWIMVNVRGELSEMAIVGWTVGAALKQTRYRNHPKARNPSDYWMPIGELLLPELLATFTW